MPANPPKTADQPTRRALIEAAVHLFGRKGFDGASTREIAARAGANVAAIAYHFGGKEGLRLACLDAIGEQFGEIVAVDGPLPPGTPADARRRLERILRAGVRFMVMPGPAEDFAAFLMREIVFDGPLIGEIYARLFAPQHSRLCALWAAATGGDAGSADTRLAVFAMIGQILYFRIGQPIILRRMDWSEITAAEADAIADILVRNLHAALTAAERSPP